LIEMALTNGIALKTRDAGRAGHRTVSVDGTIRSRRRFQIRAIRADGRISGFARPGAAIEAINLSRIAASRLCLNDTIVIAKADLKGNFAGRIAGFSGDLVRLRTRYPGEA
jgi:hypothetical protein